MDRNEAISSYSEALCDAVEERNLNLAKELLKAGANVNTGRRWREAPMILAVRNDDLEMVKLLLEYSPNVNDAAANGGRLPLVEAAKRGYLEVARVLLAYPRINVEARDSDGEFALSEASSEGNFDVFELLVEHTDYSKDHYSQALCSASLQGDTKVMCFLMEHGADVDYRGTQDEFDPPLYGALWTRHLDAARLLIRSGADVESSFRCSISNNYQLSYALRWLSEDTTRTFVSFKRLQPPDQDWIVDAWDSIVASLWFHYFGTDRQGDPPSMRNTARLPDEDFKMAYKWMLYAISSLLSLKEANLLLPHLCRVFDPPVALELCEHTGKTPLLLALEAFPRRYNRERAATGTGLLIDWNPDALKIPHPETQRIPLTCAIVHRVPLLTLQKMVTCKNEKWFTSSPLQQDPVTSLPNVLLVAAGNDCYSAADIYTFSRNYLPVAISSLQSPTRVQVLPQRRGIKRRLAQI